jgi:hypothetical protein
VHTNELLVLLGSDLYAERSAVQTLGIIERRRDLLAEKIAGKGHTTPHPPRPAGVKHSNFQHLNSAAYPVQVLRICLIVGSERAIVLICLSLTLFGGFVARACVCVRM